MGGRAVRASARRPSWNSTVCGEPALTRDAGCRSASLVWTRAQLHYLTKRQQQNVDNETTYKTLAMKQPKRSGLAWSWQRRSSPQSGVVTLFEALRQHPHPPINRFNPIITTGLTGTTPASTTRPQRSLNCGLRALARIAHLLAEHRPPRALLSCACRPRLDVNIRQQGARAPPTQRPRRRWASPSLL